MSQELDKWQLDGIYRGVKEGKSQRDIATIVGCSLPTVNKHVKQIKTKKTQSEKAETPEIVGKLEIDLKTVPTAETIKTDVLTVYRHSLYELDKRLPDMSDEQVYQLSMQLLNQLNNGNSEH